MDGAIHCEFLHFNLCNTTFNFQSKQWKSFKMLLITKEKVKVKKGEKEKKWKWDKLLNHERQQKLSVDVQENSAAWNVPAVDRHVFQNILPTSLSISPNSLDLLFPLTLHAKYAPFLLKVGQGKVKQFSILESPQLVLNFLLKCYFAFKVLQSENEFTEDLIM